MTKFAKYLQRHCVHEWSHKYVKYKQLKKLIKQQQHEQQRNHAPEVEVAYHTVAASDETALQSAPSSDTPLPSPRPSYSGLLSQLDNDPLADMPLLTLPSAPLASAEEQEQHEVEEALEMTDLRQAAATSASAVRSRRHLSAADDVAPAGGHFGVHVLPVPMSEFLAATGREVSDIERFYGDKETELLARVAELVQLPRGVATPSQQQRVAWQCKAVYRALLLLHKYRSLNYIALCKIVKKHDKLAPHSPLTPHVLPWLDRLHCFASPVPQHCMQQLVALYAAAVLGAPQDGDRAKKDLEPPTEQSASRGLRLLLSGLVAACVLGALLAVVQGVVVHFSSVELPPGALAALSIYRLLGILLVHSMLWVVCLRALKRARVNCALILGMNVDSATPLSHLAVFLAALALLYLVSLNLYLLLWQLIALSAIGSSALMAVFAVHCAVFAVIVALCCNPLFPTLRSAHRYFVSVLWQVVTLPFSSVTFQATFLANQATSLMQCLPDLTFSLCFYLHSAAASSYAEPAATAQHCSALNFTYISWWLASLPNTWRCVQCVKKYRAGAGNRSLGNAVKYGNRLILATFDGLYTHSVGPPRLLFALWVTFVVLNVLYSYYWDVAQDWGLLRSSWRSRHPLLRDEVALSSTRWYYACVLANLCFRVLSVFTVSPGVFFGESISESWTATALYEAESLRRALWNFLRLENEHSLNVVNFRANALTPFRL